MKQFTFIICFLLWTLHGYTQKKIEKIEYFFNTDPGLGKGSVVVPGNIDSLVNFDLNIPVANIPEGFNRIYFRVKDNRGRWSCTSSRLVFNCNVIAASSKIRQAEYFIDTDPGPGKATSFSISQGLETIDVSQTINIEGLAQGFHNIYIRVMDSRGVWSITGKRLFLVYSIRSNETLTNIEYFIDQDPGIGKGTSLNFSQNNGQAIVDYNIDISALSKGFHHLYTRVRSSSGKWSQTGKRVFFIKEKDAKDFSNITGLEYFIANADTSTRIFYFPLPKPQPFLDTANLIWLKDSLKLAINKRYSLYVRAVDEKGNKSPFTSDKFMFYDSIPKGDIPMNVWVPFEVAGGSPFKGNVYAGEVENLFALVKKADRLGYDATWGGEFSLIKDDKQLEKSTGSTDYDIQLTVPEGGFYDFELTTHNTKSSGFIKFTEYPDTLRLNQWDKGEILRPYGYDWKCFDVKEETDTLFIQTEGYGLWSTIEVFFENINQKTNYWQFSNMGEGYHIKGFIKAPKKGRYYIRYKDSAVLYDNQEDDKSTQRRDYLVYIGGNSHPGSQHAIKTITELSSYTFGPSLATFTISGKGFVPNDSITLINEDSTAFFKCKSQYMAGSEIIVQYDFSSLNPGSYKIALIGDTTIVHFKSILIENEVKKELAVEIISRDKFRIGRYQKSIIRISNNGNTEPKDIALYISGIPIDSKVILDYEIKPVSSEFIDSTYHTIALENELMIPLIINRLPIGEKIEIPINIFMEKPDTFTLSAIIDLNYLDKFKSPNDTDIVFYLKTFYKIDSLTYTIDSLLSLPQLKSSNDVIDQVDQSLKELGTLMTKLTEKDYGADNCEQAYAKSLLHSVSSDLFEKTKDLMYDFFFEDWGKCFNSLGSLVYENLYNGYKNANKNNAIDNTVQVFSQPDLYKNVFKTITNCSLAVLTTTPAGKVLNSSFKGAKLSYKLSKGAYKATKNQMFKTNYKQAINGLWDLKDKTKTFENLVKYGEEGYYIASTCMPDLITSIKQLFGVTSTTPEDKYGPVGHSSANATLDKQEHYIDSTQLFEYRIDYWNKENATAPAAIVYIRDTLDTDFDISTLNFTEIGFLKWKVKLDGGSYFNVNVDCRPEMPYIVNVEGTVDPVTREVFWVHKTLNPKTMELPDDPLSGYLPPIDSTGYQIGWVDFNIKAKPGLPDGTLFSNQARVNFDGVGKWGPAPPYGPYINTWDKTEPVSRVLDLPAEVVADSVLVKWKGSDSGSGIKAYSVFVSNNNDYKKWINSSTDTMAWFKGEKGTAYRFYSIATDFVGNIESPKQNYEALTRFVSTGINKKHDTNEKKFLIYPNPASCCFTIQLAWIPKNIVNIEIYNTLGEHVYSAQTVIQKTEIDLGQLPKGIYIIKVLNNSEIFYQNLILQ